MDHWDVIVAGAGQAGCAAAWDLAAGGARVLLIHTGEGREKPCAGGLTIKALRRYRFALDSVIRETVSTLNLPGPGGDTRIAVGEPFCVMTHRRELDALCRERAGERGADWTQANGVRAVRQSAAGVVLELRDGRRYRAAYLIAADGAHSPLRRLLQGSQAGAGALALEAHVPRERLRHYPPMTLDFGAIRQGYGWLFPKGDHVNVGLYVWRRERARPTLQALRDYARRSLGCDRLDDVGGYPLGTWLTHRASLCGRVLFVGDAAGATEALLGEGIYGALVSGQLAASAILAGRAQDYPLLLARWRDELRQVERLTQVFYRSAPVGCMLLRHGLAPTLLRGYARGWTLGQTKRAWRGATPGGAPRDPDGGPFHDLDHGKPGG